MFIKCSTNIPTVRKLKKHIVKSQLFQKWSDYIVYFCCVDKLVLFCWTNNKAICNTTQKIFNKKQEFITKAMFLLCSGEKNLSKVHSFLKQCLHGLQFMTTRYFNENFPNYTKLTSAKVPCFNKLNNTLLKMSLS